jgi:hypothetical protein
MRLVRKGRQTELSLHVRVACPRRKKLRSGCSIKLRVKT